MASRIEDVARRANVAKSTASLAFSSPDRVSEQTRKRIWEAAEALGYRPNALAQGLRMGRSNLIGLVMADTRNPFNGELLQQVQAAALERGYMVIASTTDDSSARERHVLEQLTALRVGGILLVPHSDGAAFVEFLGDLRAKVGLLDHRLDGVAADLVTSDNVLGARILTEHLLRLGHQRIAHITGAPTTWTAQQRIAGYTQALNSAGVAADQDLVVPGDYRGQSGYEQTMALLTRSERPTAIFAANNLMALGSLKAMGDLGISCPEEVSLVTFDDVPWAEVVRPRITCVVQPVPEIARLSVQWLLDRIELKDEAPAPRERYFTPTLIRGGSTAAPASSRPKTALPTG